MLHAAIQVILFGLLAGFSPLAFTATLAVMPSGRLKALAFGAGFIGAQILTCSVLVIFSIAATGLSRNSHPDSRAALEIAVALALIDDGPRGSPQTPEHERHLRRARTLEGAGPGSARETRQDARPHDDRRRIRGLGIGGPKRLVLTFLTAAVIVTAGVGERGKGGACRCLRHDRDRARVGPVRHPLPAHRQTHHRVHGRRKGRDRSPTAGRSPSSHSWFSPRSSCSTQAPFCSPDARLSSQPQSLPGRGHWTQSAVCQVVPRGRRSARRHAGSHRLFRFIPSGG